MTEQKTMLKNRFTLLIVVGIFCVPFVYSWWVLNFTNVVEEGGKSNYGYLIVPTRPLPDLVLADPLGQRDEVNLYGKWNLFYIADDHCDQPCVENLFRMRQLRLTMGKDDHRVQRVILFIKSDNSSSQAFHDYPGQWIVSGAGIDTKQLAEHFRLSEPEHPEQLHRLYIIDPLGNLMMSYPPDADPSGIIKDLKKLLKHSKIG